MIIKTCLLEANLAQSKSQVTDLAEQKAILLFKKFGRSGK